MKFVTILLYECVCNVCVSVCIHTKYLVMWLGVHHYVSDQVYGSLCSKEKNVYGSMAQLINNLFCFV